MDISPSGGHSDSRLPGASLQGSAIPIPGAHGNARQDVSNLHELSQSILNTPGQMSNFVRQRGFLDPGRMLRAPQFSNVPRMGNNGMQNDVSNISHTGLAGMNQG